MMRQFDEQLTSGNQFAKIGVGNGFGDGIGVVGCSWRCRACLGEMELHLGNTYGIQC